MADGDLLALDQAVGRNILANLEAQPLTTDCQWEAQSTPLPWHAGLEGDTSAMVAHSREAINQRQPRATDRGNVRTMSHVATNVGDVHGCGEVEVAECLLGIADLVGDDALDADRERAVMCRDRVVVIEV